MSRGIHNPDVWVGTGEKLEKVKKVSRLTLKQRTLSVFHSLERQGTIPVWAVFLAALGRAMSLSLWLRRLMRKHNLIPLGEVFPSIREGYGDPEIVVIVGNGPTKAYAREFLRLAGNRALAISINDEFDTKPILGLLLREKWEKGLAETGVNPSPEGQRILQALPTSPSRIREYAEQFAGNEMVFTYFSANHLSARPNFLAKLTTDSWKRRLWQRLAPGVVPSSQASLLRAIWIALELNPTSIVLLGCDFVDADFLSLNPDLDLASIADKYLHKTARRAHSEKWGGVTVPEHIRRISLMLMARKGPQLFSGTANSPLAKSLRVFQMQNMS
jgi:hypothetical protein